MKWREGNEKYLLWWSSVEHRVKGVHDSILRFLQALLRIPYRHYVAAGIPEDERGKLPRRLVVDRGDDDGDGSDPAVVDDDIPDDRTVVHDVEEVEIVTEVDDENNRKEVLLVPLLVPALLGRSLYQKR